jgi:hypothetical protein
MALSARPDEPASLDAISDYLEPSLELLKHYRARIGDFDRERSDTIARIADIEAQNAEMHRLRWELRAREEEVRGWWHLTGLPTGLPVAPPTAASPALRRCKSCMRPSPPPRCTCTTSASK